MSFIFHDVSSIYWLGLQGQHADFVVPDYLIISPSEEAFSFSAEVCRNFDFSPTEEPVDSPEDYKTKHTFNVFFMMIFQLQGTASSTSFV